MKRARLDPGLDLTATEAIIFPLLPSTRRFSANKARVLKPFLGSSFIVDSG